MMFKLLLLFHFIYLVSGYVPLPPVYPQCTHNNLPICSETSSELLPWKYNSTVYPNFAGDKSSQAAQQSIDKFYPLLSTQCSKYVKLFLCSVYSPACTDYGVVPPCRDLCEIVVSQCSDIMEVFDIKLSERLECSNFPSYLGGRSSFDEDISTSYDEDGFVIITRSRSLMWEEMLLDGGNICIPAMDTDVVGPAVEMIRSKEEQVIEQTETEYEDMGIWCPGDLKSGPSGFNFLNLENCSAPCPNMYLNEEELWIVRHYILVLAIICIAVTSFVLLTFAINTKRFKYPERPIIFYAASYFVVSFVFLTGYILGDQVPCNEKLVDEENLIVQGFVVSSGTDRKLCVSIFMILYYFTVNGTIWWLILTFTWLLAAGFKWGSEAIEQYSAIYHTVAWGIPALHVITVLVMGKVEGDNIAGVCYLGMYDSDALKWILLVPMCIYLLVGVIILFTGFLCLNRVRKRLSDDEENKRKLEKFMIRIGVFSFLYIIPQIALILIYAYEEVSREAWHATWYATTCRQYGVPCPAPSHPVGQLSQDPSSPSVLLFCLKYTMTMVVALPPLFWIASKKTCDSWLNKKTNWSTCCYSTTKNKLNTTERNLLSESNGPHSRDRDKFSQMKCTKAEKIIFGNFPTNHVRGSSASVAAVLTERQRRWDDLTDSDSSIEQIRGYRGRNIPPPHLHFTRGGQQRHRKSMDEIFNNRRSEKMRNITAGAESTKRPQSSRTSGESAAKLPTLDDMNNLATIALADNRAVNSKLDASVTSQQEASKRNMFNETIVVSADNNMIRTEQQRTTVISQLDSNPPPMLDSTRIMKVDSIVSLTNCENGTTLAI